MSFQEGMWLAAQADRADEERQKETEKLKEIVRLLAPTVALLSRDAGVAPAIREELQQAERLILALRAGALTGQGERNGHG